MLLVANNYMVSRNLDRAYEDLAEANQMKLTAADYVAMAQVRALMAIAEALDAAATKDD